MAIDHDAHNVLLALYDSHASKVSDKWFSYLSAYDTLFQPYRDKPVRILEIGIQNGGSLEIWSKYFPNAEVIVGCDIDPLCADLKYEEDRIHVVVGDANTDDIQRQITGLSEHFDIIIDDGSHVSSDIVRSFARYYPMVVPGGLFVAEDLHCSYWTRFEGGLQAPFSSVSFFKRLGDMVNFEHWGGDASPQDALGYFSETYNVEFDRDALLTIQSVSFLNSICTVRKGLTNKNKLGHRVISGQIADVSPEPIAVKDQEIAVQNQTLNPWGPDQRSGEAMVSLFPALSKEKRALEDQVGKLEDQVGKLEADLAWANETIRQGQKLLNEARCKPFRTIRHYVIHRILGVLAKATPPLPPKVTDRFEASAVKRDPEKPIR